MAEFITLVYEAQHSLATLDVDSVAHLAGVASMTDFKACRSSDDAARAIESDIALAKKFGSGGTPSVIVNGERFGGGGPSFDDVRALLEKH